MGRLEAKAFNLRAMVEVLEARGWLATIRASIPPEAQLLVDHPPPASVWVDGQILASIPAAVAQHYGRSATCEVTRESIRRGALRFLRPLVEGTLRLFGTTPNALFSRIGLFTAQTARGIELRYEPTNGRSGRLIIVVDDPRPLPEAYFLLFVATAEEIFALTRTTGRIEDPQVVATGSATTATIALRW